MSNIYIVTFLVGLILTSVFIILHKQTNAIAITGLTKQGNRLPTFIITGLSNSGKTALFTKVSFKISVSYNELVSNCCLQLTTGKVSPTVTSQEPNVTTKFPLPSTGQTKTNFKLIDFPGHNKLHNLTINEIKTSTNIFGLIFLIDSSIDPKKISESAKFLYEILSTTERRPGGVDILIGCNKSDLFSARQSQKIKELLELEIDSYRKLNAHNISKVDNDEVDEEFSDLGQSINSNFRFDLLEGNFDVVSGSVLKDKIEKWECWIDERAVNY